MTSTMKSIDVSDLDDLFKLNQEIFKEEILYDRNYLERFCKLKQGYILRKNNEPLGYVIFGMTYCNSKRIFTIVSIGVSQLYRGKGYGKLLLQTVVDRFPDREISLHVRVTNKVAQKMYSSLGFQIKDLEEKYYHQLNDDAYHMVKHIEQNTSNNINTN